MPKIHIIQPMGGGGTRFKKQGFVLPKPLLELKDKPFFYCRCYVSLGKGLSYGWFSSFGRRT